MEAWLGFLREPKTVQYTEVRYEFEENGLRGRVGRHVSVMLFGKHYNYPCIIRHLSEWALSVSSNYPNLAIAVARNGFLKPPLLKI